jgi:hypothetical protein
MVLHAGFIFDVKIGLHLYIKENILYMHVYNVRGHVNSSTVIIVYNDVEVKFEIFIYKCLYMYVYFRLFD